MLEESLNTFDRNITGYKRKQRVNDIILCALRYNITPKEYFLFGFHTCNRSDYRAAFLCDWRKDALLIEKGLLNSFKSIIKDKVLFYDRFRSFFGRRCIPISSIDDYSDFKALYSIGDNIFVKERTGSFGAKAFLIKDKSDFELQRIFKSIINSGGQYIAEELIIQNKIMASWNSSSVNTVRVPSLFYQKNTGEQNHLILQPFMRTGRKGEIVDNGGAGGIFAVIDTQTGFILTDGFDEEAKSYKQHPDSGITYKGFLIPEWQNLKELTLRIHSLIPEQPYIGFDFAYTDKGWILIEGNWGQFLGQYATKEGIRKPFEDFISQIHK